MTIEKKMFGKQEMLVKPIGRIDMCLAPELEKEVNAEIDNITYLTVDLSETDYISSIGLRALLSFQKIMDKKGSMKVVNVKPEVMEIFKLVGFDKIFDII